MGAVLAALGAALILIAIALLAAPVSAQAPTVTVSSPDPGSIVEGTIEFAGTATDPDGNLGSVKITVQGLNPTLKVNLPGAKYNATWSLTWGSQSVGDGRREVSVVALDKSQEASAPINFTLIIDNFKEPFLENTQVFFDSAGDGMYTPWNALQAVPTTRVGFELRFTEPIEATTLQEAVSFAGGPATWALEPGATEELYWLNVSYLQVNTTYELTVGTSATDMAGNPLQSAQNLTFHTASEATPGTPEPGGGFFLPVDPLWIWISAGAAGAAVGVVVLHRRGILGKAWEALRRVPERFQRGEE